MLQESLKSIVSDKLTELIMGSENGNSLLNTLPNLKYHGKIMSYLLFKLQSFKFEKKYLNNTFYSDYLLSESGRI